MQQFSVVSDLPRPRRQIRQPAPQGARADDPLWKDETGGQIARHQVEPLRVKAAGAPDIPGLSIKLDEAVRLVDELPLLSSAEPRAAPSAPAVAASAPSNSWPDWSVNWKAVTERIWLEVKSLVRVTRIDHPESMLLAPDNAFFVRENLKLRLLNARLAVLSRQFDTAQRDLQVVQATLDRYFDRSSRRTALASDIVRQVSAQTRQVPMPRPDDTLVALAAANAGR